MRVDFYQLTLDPAEWVVPLIARATLAAGERLLVVSGDPESLTRVDAALWERLPEAFLAHGMAGHAHATRQPVLLSGRCEAENGARYLALADGQWREEAAGFGRVFLLFGEARLQDARECWRMLGTRAAVERHFWKQEEGKWREGP